MLNMKNHPYHMVDYSPWPFKATMALLNLMTSTLNLLFNKSPETLPTSLLAMIAISYQWWRDISREASLQGLHSMKTTLGMKSAMILFIMSEVMLFSSFFWMYLHSSLSANIEMGLLWPPKMVMPFHPLKMPLLNTLILLTSGITLTMSHNYLLKNKMMKSNLMMMKTLPLGVYYTYLQMKDYLQSHYNFNDSSFGSSFFISTGFHGIHVIVGSTFLLVILARKLINQLSKMHHMGLEAASWYWHFVDVVWILLYSIMYYWLF